MSGRNRVPIEITTTDDLFKTDEMREVEQAERVRQVPVSAISEFPNHPFKVLEGDEMERIKESIREYGVLTPAIAREKDDGYELISGHRRLAACKALDIETLPIIVRSMTDDEAVIFMVDANLQREHILPSEKAFAYKMKLDAMNRQGKRADLTSRQVGEKLWSVDEMSEKANESARNIHRYIRLTHLIPELLQMVDDKKIAFNPAVELSYLTEEQQRSLLAAIEQNDCTPSHEQTIQFKKLSQDQTLTDDAICAALSEPKPNQVEQIKVPADRIDKYLKKNATAKDRQVFLDKAIEYYGRMLLRKRDEPER